MTQLACRHWHASLTAARRPGYLWAVLTEVCKDRAEKAGGRTRRIVLKKVHSSQADAVYPCRMKHLLRSKADLDGEATALGYILGC